MTLEQFTFILTKLAYAYPNFKLDKELVLSWFDIFKSFSLENFHSALLAAIKDREQNRGYFPDPGLVCQYLSPPDKTAEDIWQELCSLASQSKEMSYLENIYDEKTVKAVRSVGWSQIRHADLETVLPHVRRNFIDAYNAISENEHQNTYLEISHSEAKNTLDNLFGKASPAENLPIEHKKKK